MYGKVKIGNREIEMIANAATPYKYKGVFGEDLLRLLYSAQAKKDMMLVADKAAEIAYIMAMQAKNEDFGKLNEQTFEKWLEDFEPLDFVKGSDKILIFYFKQQKTESKARKK